MAKTDPTQENVNQLLAEIRTLKEENRRFAEESVKLLQQHANQVADLKSEIRAKQAILRAVEWIADEHGDEYCPYCRGKHPEDTYAGGHHPDCALFHETRLEPQTVDVPGALAQAGFTRLFTVTYHGCSGLPDELILNGMTYVKKDVRDS